MKLKLTILFCFTLAIFHSQPASSQWLDETNQNVIYLASDLGFFQSKTGISLNTTSVSTPDVRRTTDGGQTWTSVDMSKFNGTFDALSIISTTTGYAGGNQLITTTNAGSSWDSISNISFTGQTRANVYIESMLFVSASVGFATLAANDKVIYKTTNGGKTWAVSGTASAAVTGFYSFDANDVYAIIDFNSIYYTNDGGSSWKSFASSDFSQPIYGALFMNANTGYVCGANATLFNTTDGGTTWKSSKLDTNVDLLGIQFLDANNAIISATSEVTFTSTNGGSTWKHHYTPDNNSFFLYDLHKAYFFDKSTGAAMGKTGVEAALLSNTHLNAAINTSSENLITLDIYPNPAQSDIHIRMHDWDDNATLTLYNSAGIMIYSGSFNGSIEKTISLNNYAKGVYTVKVISNSGIAHQQFIVE
jgi:photosystem II stability/assembly factor-like uncharacterized protein